MMSSRLAWLTVPVVLLGTLAHLSATAAQEAAAPQEIDHNAEIQNLKGWKDYLSAELEKCKSESEQSRTALQGEQHRVFEIQAQVTQLTQAATDAQAKLAAADALAVQVEQLKQELADATSKATNAESKASANAAAANAANGEASALRKQLSDTVTEKQALEARLSERASAKTQAAAGLHTHAVAILNILMAEVAKHKDVAVNIVNEKLPGFKAKVSEVQDILSVGLNNATALLAKVEGELKPFLRAQLAVLPVLKQYGEDPVVLQALVYAVLGAPLLLVLPLLSICYRLVARRPASHAGRATEGKRGKKKRPQV